MKKKIFRYSFLVIFPLFVIALLAGVSRSRYTVVIDPGHGGLSLNPVAIHGDKYDPIEGRYLAPYQQGASYGQLFEGELAYEIGLMVKEYLDLTGSSQGRKKFHNILKKYNPLATEPKESIRVLMSRSEGFQSDLSAKYDGVTDKDLNADFRLFDFPDFTSGLRKAGLISRINAQKPDLVVSLHFDSIGPPRGAMAAVVTPGFATYKKSIDYLKGDSLERKKILREFMNSPYADWVQMNSGDRRSAFEWFLCDSWIYFTGYWSVKNGLMPDINKFRGIRQDYIDWNYEGNSWTNSRSSTVLSKRTQIPDLEHIDLTTNFWKREQYRAEDWRREGGREGVGGDNLYASNELLRFIRLGLYVNGSMSNKKLPEIRDPHWSTWSLPTYVNAVNAFLELGFLNNRHDRERIVHYKNEHAEALAVGIYSLLYGVKMKSVNLKDMPVGESLNLNKYRDYNGINYFQDVKH